MTPAARTIVVFGCYLLGVGAVVLLAPNVLLGLLGIPATDEPWIRIAGMLVLVLAWYYIASGRGEATAFMRATVPGRLFGAGALVVIAAVWGYWTLMLFAVPDVASAAWTWAALHGAAKTPAAPGPAA